MKKTQTTTKRGKYRKQGYVKIQNQEIVGLKKRPDGRFYSAEVPTKTFGKDPEVALLRFSQWQAEQKGETVTLASERNKRTLVPPTARYQELLPPQFRLVDILHDIPAAEFWQVVKEKILADPFEAARKTGLPLDRLESLPKPRKQKTLSLSEIGELYQLKSFKYDRERDFSELTWNHFCRIVGKATLDKITEDDLLRFDTWVKGKHPRGEWTKTEDTRKFKQQTKHYSPRFIKNLYGKIASILNHAAKMRKDFADELKGLKTDFRRICTIPTQKKGNPQPIDVEDFNVLLKAADQRMQCILMLSLNAALHPSEAADLLKSEFSAKNLKNREFVSNRTKTGESRVARLWTRTVKLIREYKQSPEYQTNHSDYLFANAKGGRLTGRSITDAFKRLRVNAGLDDSVKFDGIRDLFRKAAGAKNFIAIKWVMGHSLPGEDDAYAFRDVVETEETMRKVEEYVFDRKRKGR